MGLTRIGDRWTGRFIALAVAGAPGLSPVWIAAMVVVAMVIGAGAGYYVSVPADGIVPGVHVAGIPVGGLTPREAEAVLAHRLEALMERPLYLHYGSEVWQEAPRAIGIEIDLSGTIAKAYAVGREGGWVRRLNEQLAAAWRGIESQVEIKVDQARFDAWLQDFARRVERPPKDAGFAVRAGGDVVVIPSEMGYRLASDGLAQRIARAAVDPYARAVRVTVNPVEPAWTTVDAEALGIRKQIASFTTRFHPADVNRTANIYVAAQALDGTILRPGELFSFNQRVGPRVEAAGYKEAPVIINGELVPDIGGGVCQVSTTLYGAVLLAGLKVDARTPHSIPVSYVPMGLDAAVVYDAVDFRFQNNTSGHLLVRAWVEQDRLTVALYGEGPADRPVGLETEIVEVIAAPMVRVVRPELAGGEQRIVRAGREGYRVRVWRVIETPEGIKKRELVSRSYYPARERVIWVGAESAV